MIHCTGPLAQSLAVPPPGLMRARGPDSEGGEAGALELPFAVSSNELHLLTFLAALTLFGHHLTDTTMTTNNEGMIQFYTHRHLSITMKSLLVAYVHNFHNRRVTGVSRERGRRDGGGVVSPFRAMQR